MKLGVEKGLMLIVSKFLVVWLMCMYLIKIEKRLDAKSELCIFIGYSETSKAYKLYNPLTNKLIVSRDVIFDEGGVYGHQKGHVEKKKSVLNDDIIVDNDHEQPINVSVTSGLIPPSNPSSISSTSSSSPTYSPSSTRKVRRLSDIYEIVKIKHMKKAQ